MKNHNGFSLIELLIVVVIIGIIASIAIPNLLAARRAANEASAIASLRTYHSAQLVYQATEGAGCFAGDLRCSTVGGASEQDGLLVLKNAGLIDPVLATKTKSGYTFFGFARSSTGDVSQFIGLAIPADRTSLVSTGTRNFTIGTDGVIYSAPAGNAYFRNEADGSWTLLGQPLGGK